MSKNNLIWLILFGLLLLSTNKVLAEGKLNITTTDHDGWAKVFTMVSRWNDHDRKWIETATIMAAVSV